MNKIFNSWPYVFILLSSGFPYHIWDDSTSPKTIDELDLDYEDERNAMIAISEKDQSSIYEDFYEDMDNRIEIGQTMNIIFFGPSSSFLRIDAETLLHLLQYTKKHLIPITRAILAWDMITDGKTAAYLQGRDFLAFGSLLNVIPEEDLHYVNFGDPSVMKFFSSTDVDLLPRKMGILVSAYRRYYGNGWYQKATYINELGYLLCGFPPSDLSNIPPTVFKDISVDTFKRISKCSREQLNVLYTIAVHPYAYGIPYTWTAHHIGRLGPLLNCIPANDIGELQLEATSAIKFDVMKEMDAEKLQFFSKQQILNMRPRTRRIYILRMQLQSSYDMENISAAGAIQMKISIVRMTLFASFIFLIVFVCQ